MANAGGAHTATRRHSSVEPTLTHEVHTLSLVREKTHIPAFRVFGFESMTSNPVGVPFFLMEFIPGNTAMDAFGGYDVHCGEIPAQ
jgi:aminoglycoside phosphotransferase (APT) family kinase protein